MKVAGAVLTLAGGAAAIVSMFLDYLSDLSKSLWDLTTRYPVLFTVLTGAAMALAVLALVVNRWPPAVFSAAISWFLLGQSFEMGAPDYDPFGVGFWILVGGSLTMAVGGLLLTGGLASESRYEGWSDARVQAAAAVPIERSATPPAGWYPDPGRLAGERYWSGDAWTSQVR
jgi:hypothetical protein